MSALTNLWSLFYVYAKQETLSYIFDSSGNKDPSINLTFKLENIFNKSMEEFRFNLRESDTWTCA